MNEKIKLPDPNQFFGIRFESIGGMGAHTAGKILATSAVLRMGLNGAYFSSAGAEKNGAIVRSFIRLASLEKPIRTTAPIESPNVLVVFHNALLKNPTTIAGMKANGILIYNGAESDELPAIFSHLPSTTTVIRVDAQRITLEEKSKPNAALLGTLTATLPFLDSSTILQAFSDEGAQFYPEAVAANKKAFQRGTKEITTLSNVGKANGDLPIAKNQPIWGYETAPIGGTLPLSGNTISNDLTAMRAGKMPIYHVDKCIHCGICDMVCPDFCLVWKPAENNQVHLEGIDYRYCKGCLRCVESCSTGALRRKTETPGLADQLQVKLFPELEGGV